MPLTTQPAATSASSSPPPFDLQAYISRYEPQSETRLQRLLFVAHYFHEQSVILGNAGGGVGGGGVEILSVVKEGTSDKSKAGENAGESNASNSSNNYSGNHSASQMAFDIAQEAFEMAVDQMKHSGNYRRYLEEFGALPGEDRSGVGGGGDSSNPEVTGMVGGVGGSTTGGGVLGTLGTPLRGRSGSHSSHSDHHHVHPNSIHSVFSSPHGHPYHQHHQHHHHGSHHKPPITHHLPYDPHFAPQSKLEGQSQLEQLEGRLATAQSHIVKESIKAALLALGEFHRGRGELREAWRRVARSREYCIGGTRDGGQVALMMIELGIDLREWSSVRDTISRAEHTPIIVDASNQANTATSSMNSGMVDLQNPHRQMNQRNTRDQDPLFHQKLRAAMALTHLAQSNYLSAAKGFTSLSTDLTNQFNSVISAEDVALYGALLGLATLERGKLKELVIDSPGFKGRLELIPQMRDALRHYSRAEYGQCLSILTSSSTSSPASSLHRDMLLDIHLYSHVPTLLEMIRDRCIVQYFQPYQSVSLKKMGEVFGCGDVGEMEEVVARLVSAANGGYAGGSDGDEDYRSGGRGRGGSSEGGGVVLSLGEGARINSLEKTLSVEGRRSMERKARRRARVRAAKMGNQFARNAEGMILRIACLENGMFIPAESQPKYRGRSGGAGMGGGGAMGGGGTDVGGGGGGRHRHDHRRMDYPEELAGFESGGSTDDDVDDAMEVGENVVNPNDF